jgi:hypothetical protein
VTSGHTIQCQATVMLNTYCYALSGDAEAYWCDSEDCYWWALVTQAQLDALAQAFENSNQAAPHIHKTRVETCNC